MDLDGRGLVRATRGNDINPVWSPDGRTLLFTRVRRPQDVDDNTTDLYAVADKGGNPRRLVSGPGLRALDWSPDGSKILFLRGEPIPGKREKLSYAMWMMNADGTAPTRLPFNRPGWDVLSADW